MQPSSPSGLHLVPRLEWGCHLAHFFGTGDELRDVLVPYFKAGLENNERCLWVTGKAFDADKARSALRAALPDLDKREGDLQIEIVNGDEWYASGEKLRPYELVKGLEQRERDALVLGYTGLRTNGNCSWVLQDQWTDFLEYEALVQQAVRGRRMICMCSYCTDQIQNGAQLQVMERHDLAVPSSSRSFARRSGVIRPKRRHRTVKARSTPQPMRMNCADLLERQKRAFDLAMVASDMGTWRYTMADNICVYDENAQRLYGLTEARFLHDEGGVKAKFHPDDLELMWTRVAKALDPEAVAGTT